MENKTLKHMQFFCKCFILYGVTKHMCNIFILRITTV